MNIGSNAYIMDIIHDNGYIYIYISWICNGHVYHTVVSLLFPEPGPVLTSETRQEAPDGRAVGLLNEMQSKRLRLDEVPCPMTGDTVCRLCSSG